MSSEDLAPTVPRGPAGVLPWYAAMAALAVAFIACYVFFVRTRLGQWIDDAALLGGQAFLAADATRKPALAFLDYMPAFSAVLSGAVLLWALVRRRDFMRPVIAGLSILGASGTTQLLKHVVLERPDLNISGATVNSFPSGHTTFAAAAMMSIFLVSPAARRPLVALGGWAYAAVAGASTLGARLAPSQRCRGRLSGGRFLDAAGGSRAAPPARSRGTGQSVRAAPVPGARKGSWPGARRPGQSLSAQDWSWRCCCRTPGSATYRIPSCWSSSARAWP